MLGDKCNYFFNTYSIHFFYLKYQFFLGKYSPCDFTLPVESYAITTKLYVHYILKLSITVYKG